MNKKYQTLLILLALTSLNVLLMFNNVSAQPTIELEADIDITVIRIGGFNPQKVTIKANVTGQNLQFDWNIDGPGELLESAKDLNVYTPPNRMDAPTAQTTITATITDDKGNQKNDKLTFKLIPFSTQEQLIRLEIRMNTEKYETFKEQEQQGVNINEQIILILKNTVEKLKEIENIYKKFSKRYPEMLQEVNQTLYIRKAFERELFDRLSIEFRSNQISIKGSKGNLIKPVKGVYSLKLGHSVTVNVNVDVLIPHNHEFKITWSARYGKISKIKDKTVTYTPKKPGLDYLIFAIEDSTTGQRLPEEPISIIVSE